MSSLSLSAPGPSHLAQAARLHATPGDGPALAWFGVPTCTDAAGRVVRFRAERPFQLLAYLAYRRTFVTRDELAALFFPDRPAVGARANLRKVLFLAQRIDGLPPLEQQADRLRWLVESDLTLFEAAAAAGRHSEVLERYRPPLFDGLDDGLPAEGTVWIGFERQRVEGLWRDAAAASLAALAGAPGDAASLAERLLAIDASDGVAVRALGEACLALGQPERAIRALSAYSGRLVDDYGIEMPAAMRALEQRLRGDPRQDAEPAGTSEAAARSYRHAANAAGEDALVGRRHELSQLAGFLAEPECRVVTVLGPGGIGKSRLVEALPPILGKRFGGREVVVVGLEQATTVIEVAAQLATAVGLDFAAGEPWPQLAAHLALRPAFLVLDNAEHLVEDGLGRALAILLDAAPNLQMVVASRTRLSVAGEWILPLDGLPLPDADETDPDVLRANDAVVLFERRARVTSRTFDLAAQASDVVRLVHLVDGMPLAIELAAAWVRLLPVADLVDEIGRSVDLLDASASSTVVRARDTSLRASFARSWERIAERERDALARLALLPGAFGRAMAQQVAQAPLPVLATLADKSLLRVEGDGRFSLHPLVRQCVVQASASLPNAIVPTEAAERHGLFVAEWLGMSFDPLDMSRGLLSTIERDFAHVRAAWRWAIEARRPEPVERGAWTLAQFFQARGRGVEGIDWMREAAATFTAAGDRALRAVLHATRALSELQLRFSTPEELTETARIAWRLARRLRDRHAMKSGINLMGLAHYRQDHGVEAKRWFEQSLAYERADGDERRIAIVLLNLGLVEDMLGRHDAAAACFVESASISRRRGNLATLAGALNNLAGVRNALEQWSDAETAATEALEAYEASGQVSKRPHALNGRAAARAGLGKVAAARQDFERSIAMAQEHGQPSSVVEASLGLVRIELLDRPPTAEAMDSARRHLVEAVAGARRIGWRALGISCVVTEARRRAADGQPGEALALGDWAATHAEIEAAEAGRWRRERPTIAASATAGDANATRRGAEPLPRLDEGTSLDDVLHAIERHLAEPLQRN